VGRGAGAGTGAMGAGEGELIFAPLTGFGEGPDGPEGTEGPEGPEYPYGAGDGELPPIKKQQ